MFVETKTIDLVEEDPTLVFDLIKEGNIEIVDKLLKKKKVDINICDDKGNNILVRLLKAGAYDVVYNHMNNKNWDVNHQNNDGDTFAHILLSINNLSTIDIYKELRKIKKFIPNIRNNNGETILDKSIQNGNTLITSKILEDERFNEVGVHSFKTFYDTYIKSHNFGKYTRLNNLEMIIDNLEYKEISPRVKEIINYLKENFDAIKEEVINNKTRRMDVYLKEALFS